jgi:hypothetical protein
MQRKVLLRERERERERNLNENGTKETFIV